MSGESPVAGTVCATVVTFHPDAGMIARLELVAGQVDALIIVDNGSSDVAVERLSQWAKGAGARLLANRANLGSGTALNQAARAAAAAGHAWMLTLDQDTTVPDDLVVRLRAAIAADAHPARVALAAPVTKNQDNRRCREAIVVRRRVAITSGSLVSLEAWRAVGGYRDDFFIDMVDADFCLRLSERGYRAVLACQAAIHHEIGAPRSHRLLGMWVTSSHHPAWRRYYISRNRVFVWRSHWRHAPAFVLFDAYGHVRDTAVMALTEDDRRRKLAATLRGFSDGVRGRSGHVFVP